MRICVHTSATSLYKSCQQSKTLKRGSAIRCILAASVERETEGDYPNAQTKYLEVLRKELGNYHRRGETDSNTTL